MERHLENMAGKQAAKQATNLERYAVPISPS
jgi:hypothetical protein